MSNTDIFLHHFGIMAPRDVIKKVYNFYVDIVGLSEGYRPDASLPGYWLYSGDNPIIHLTENENKEASAPGFFHHLALRCEGVDKYVTLLNEIQIPYKRVDIDDVGQTQLVLFDPAGTKVELNFATEN